jgi:hypothetical protein
MLSSITRLALRYLALHVSGEVPETLRSFADRFGTDIDAFVACTLRQPALSPSQGGRLRLDGLGRLMW